MRFRPATGRPIIPFGLLLVLALAFPVLAADGGPPGRFVGVPTVPPGGNGPDAPMEFLVQNAAQFGMADPRAQLVPAGSEVDTLGFTHTRFHQTHKGVPVFGGVIKVHQNALGTAYLANGHFLPIPDKLPVTPLITAEAAQASARTLVAGSPAVSKCELVIVDPGWYGDPPQGARLAWHLILEDLSVPLCEAFFVDALEGSVLDRWSMIDSARNRAIHNGNGGNQIPGPLARAEGQPATGIADVDAAYDYYGDTYDYFFRAHGRDSINGAGMILRATVNSTAPGCPNAFWHPTLLQMVFCSDLVTDDIVAHELSHGLTQFTADLVYQNQPGQLNESFSDVFGELVDLFNGDAAFVGPPGGPPNWPTHPTGPGHDTPNNARTACSQDPTYGNGYRWLMGEDAVSLGALRDMWSPPCFGDPDKASSPLQICAGEDGGGVHSGSGIPNHAFAMLVDGKVFNGQTVTGIGPIKAGAVWYRALTAYLTPISDFQMAYEAFVQAAADLVGTFPNDPRTGLPSTSMFTQADAEQVTRALLAAEMHTPGRCGSTFRTEPVSVCPDRNTIFSDDFEGGVNGWTVSNVTQGAAYDWVQTAALPRGRSGKGWKIEDRRIGDCYASFVSGQHFLVSPEIVMPASIVKPAILFTHYFRVETGWDGGNLDLRVNGGQWVKVPGINVSYNGYPMSLYGSSYSDNPLAGQLAWTGSSGEWGQVLVDLTSLVAAADTIQVRFTFGKDCGYGEDGWYVDDFEVFHCGEQPPIAQDVQASTMSPNPVTITLRATDDGYPQPPSLAYIITSLPQQGALSEGANPIAGVPYVLPGGANQVVYTPAAGTWGTDSFEYKASDGGTAPDGGDSNTATVTVSTIGPIITVNPVELRQSINVLQDGADQTFEVTNTGGANLAVVATPDVAWLQAALDTGTDPGPLGHGESQVWRVSFSTSALSPGNYTGSIVLSSPAPGISPVTIPVYVRINGPIPASDPGSVASLLTQEGDNVARQTFRIHNAGPGVLQYTLEVPDVPWLKSIKPLSGTCSGDQKVIHTIDYDTRSLAANGIVGVRVLLNAPTADPDKTSLDIPVYVEVKLGKTFPPLGGGPAPTQHDEDKDGIPDAIDNCPYIANKTQSNVDGDALGDACDDDNDNDGVRDMAAGSSKPGDHPCAGGNLYNCDDNCRSTRNTDQADADNDGVGDACDNCQGAPNASQLDTDGDGLGDVCDNCGAVSNPDQIDSDRDGIGNACDNCAGIANPSQRDSDNDGVGDTCDNCPAKANRDQTDADRDGIGDVCDATPKGPPTSQPVTPPTDKPADTPPPSQNPSGTPSGQAPPQNSPVDLVPTCGTGAVAATMSSALALLALQMAGRRRRR